MKRYGVFVVLLLSVWLTVVPSAKAEDDELQPMALLLSLSKTAQTTGGSGGSYSVTVTSPASWTATANVSWITVRTASGTGDGTLSYTVSACPNTTAYREGTITVKNGSSTKTLMVQQSNVVWPVADSSGTVKYNSASGLNKATDAGFKIDGKEYTRKGDVVTGLGDVTSFYGARATSANSKHLRHWAIDIDVEDSPSMVARAAMSGVVSAVGNEETNGNYVYIKHQIVKNGVTTTLYTRYLHLASYTVSVGTVVKAGQKIGIVGKTGSANGDLHLHFAVLKTVGGKNYYLNPVSYYHGSDNRGVMYNGSGTILNAISNNPMFVVSGGNWVPNPNWDPVYSAFTGTSSAFYKSCMNALREGDTIAWCVE
ncbi:MAG: peptidoglycan DD-metalloendopeptidase family protein [Lachnospiraceae bacterium]|nr:peptidoglycan DD-metalloendopeptidase family protein [Lachnospiraceae bacterium]